MLRLLKQFIPSRCGVALIEFAVVFPVLFVLLFGAIEVGRAILIAQKVEKSGYVLADIVSQYPPATGNQLAGEITETDLTQSVFAQFKTILGIYASDEKQRIIFSAIRKEGGLLRIKWQVAGGGTLSDEAVSVVNGLAAGDIGPSVRDSVATFNSDTDVQTFLHDTAPGETFIVGEVFYRYEPIFTDLLQGVTKVFGIDRTFFLSPRTIIKRMYFHPRGGDLICLPSDFLYDECRVADSHHSTTCSCVYSGSQRRTNCATHTASATDYYRCPDSTTRAAASFGAPNISLCGSVSYGSAIENYSNAALTGSCVNQ